MRFAFAVGLALTFCFEARAAEPTVEFEIAVSRELAAGAAQNWLRTLTDVGVTQLRIAQSGRSTRPEIETVGSGASTRYRVTAVVTRGNELLVPGGRFGPRDQAALGEWLQRLRDEGREAVIAGERLPFGLNSAQIAELREQLSRPVSQATAGENVAAIVDHVASELALPLQLTPEVTARLRRAPAVTEELSGLARGTVLAYVARPLGLSLVPGRDERREIELRITRANPDTDIWPIGWPLEEKRQQRVPKMFEILPVEIDDFPLDGTLAAIQQRIDVPLLYDYNNMAREGIELAAARVNYPAKRTSYSVALRTILSQHGMKYEVRLDDADEPFIWITTRRR